MNVEINTITLTVGIRVEPRITIDLLMDKPINKISDLDIDISGYKGFVTETKDTTIYGILIDNDCYNEVKSMYLGESLNAAVRSLNIKPLVESVPDLNQKFFRFNELPWQCLCRLMSYMPSNFYWYCDAEAIRVIEKPTEFTECIASDFYSDVLNARFIQKDLILDSKFNPSYHSIYSVPVSKLASDKALFSSDMIANNIQNYINRGNIYQNTMRLICMDDYAIGQGLSVNGTNFMVSYKSTTLDKNHVLRTNIYNLIEV